MDWPDIRPATAHDWPAIAALLAEAGLPLADLDADAAGRFLVAIHDGQAAGCVALDVAAGCGLLRSLAVSPAARRRGLGTALLAAAEERARALRLASLHLLTPSAQAWFARHGYRRVARLPASLATHPQATGLCPSAHLMGKAFLEEIDMSTLEVFDPAMCCATGVCGVDADPSLARFAADLAWLAEQGIEVRRHNLGQEPQAFAANPLVLKQMEAGMERLPVLLVDGELASTGIYPSREQLARRLGLVKAQIGIAAAGGCCEPGSGCC